MWDRREGGRGRKGEGERGRRYSLVEEEEEEEKGRKKRRERKRESVRWQVFGEFPVTSVLHARTHARAHGRYG